MSPTNARSLCTKGFTLMEMAIVLVVIGLLVGAVTVGASLMQQSELRGLIRGLQDVETAVNGFEMTYQGLPGDLTNADLLWTGANDNCPAACNGNGNGRIDQAERFRALQHLSLAGLVKQRLTGTAAVPPGIDDTLSSAMDGVGMMLGQVTAAEYPEANWDANDVRNVVFLGAPNVVAGTLLTTNAANGSGLHSEQAMLIDEKLDDGLPGTGRLQASNEAITDCVTTALAATAEYELDPATPRQCGVHYRLD